LEIRDMVVLGDSRLVINALISQELTKYYRISLILSHITKLTKNLRKISYYHILRENNIVTDRMENEATLLPLGTLKKNGVSSHIYIP
jgi:hypothetical protein